jgi:hypothetical protein
MQGESEELRQCEHHTFVFIVLGTDARMPILELFVEVGALNFEYACHDKSAVHTSMQTAFRNCEL